MSIISIRHGDCRDVLKTLPEQSVHCVVTSPPYFGLRDYGTATWEGGDAECDHVKGRPGSDRADGIVLMVSHRNRDGAGAFSGDCKCGARRIDSQIGLEPSPQEYVAQMVAVFRDVRRVLRDDGTVWLNLGDSYASQGGTGQDRHWDGRQKNTETQTLRRQANGGLKSKDLMGIPWRVAFALQADGWYLRQDIIWSKPNPMPESVTDRCTKAHEYIFLLSKSARYYYDAEAIAEPSAYPGDNRAERTDIRKIIDPMCFDGGSRARTGNPTGEVRNKRSVWEVATAPFSEAHFATFPPALIEPCILAGCPEKCCAKCGAPWVREISGSSYHPPLAKIGERFVDPTRNDKARKLDGKSVAWREAAASRKTIGFSPSCSCNAGTVPGTCLDPFGGAGTAGLVADRLGRNAILIELNPEYSAMAERRIADDAGMFAMVAAE